MYKIADTTWLKPLAQVKQKLIKVPNDSWIRNAVVYHIYPRSFRDGNGDGIGDLRGIIEKLDYLNDGTSQSLGVDAIWLSPVYRSPMVDFGYDVTDHCDIDPLFGTLADFDELLIKAHKRGIKVIMDFIPNHTSIDHPWFQESRSSKDNPKRDWYIWQDAKPDGSLPNNWLSWFGGSVWEYDHRTRQYYYHSFLKEQADLNWRHPEVKQAMANILRFWLDRGVDGFRIDGTANLIKDERFKDEPANPQYVAGKDDPHDALLHIYSNSQPGSFAVMNEFCQVLMEYPQRFMVSEIYCDIVDMTKFYRECDNEVHAPFNLNLIGLPWNAETYKKFIDAYELSLTPADLPTYVLGNHDRHRVATRLGRQQARVAAMLLLTLRGTPFVYYGDEIGMQDVEVPMAAVQDPFEQQVPGIGLGRDPERSPLQWNDQPYAGFSSVTPWLPIADDYQQYNIANEINDTRSILSLYRQLIHFRKQSPALLRGVYQPLSQDNPELFAYIRQSSEQKLLVVLNFSDQPQTARLDVSSGALVCTTYLDKVPGQQFDLRRLVVRPNEGYVFSL
jgi:alpha-glucosidase